MDSLMKRLLFAFLFITLSFAQAESKTKQWKGFERIDFKFENRKAHIVFPKNAAEGKPWVWRARFPGWHTDMDLILLDKGFHIAYADVAGLYGSPQAVAHWDKFYQFIQNEYKLAPKMTIECVSRGGLITYNWAKQNPKKVNCIYAEAPVCNISSWPAGQGKGIGSKGDWKKAPLAYKMTPEELLKWEDNPIDNLAPLAKAGVPIYHVIHQDDKVVPGAENTEILVKRYKELGGSAILKIQTGESKTNGHHFKIESIPEAVEFILKNTK
jgi:sialidase-1